MYTSSALSVPPSPQKYNGNPYGFTVLTGRHEPPPAAAQEEEGSVVFPGSRADMSSNTKMMRLTTGTTLAGQSNEHATGGASAAALSGSQQSILPASFGLTVDTQDDVIWLGGAPTWSYLQASVCVCSAYRCTSTHLMHIHGRAYIVPFHMSRHHIALRTHFFFPM